MCDGMDDSTASRLHVCACQVHLCAYEWVYHVYRGCRWTKMGMAWSPLRSGTPSSRQPGGAGPRERRESSTMSIQASPNPNRGGGVPPFRAFAWEPSPLNPTPGSPRPCCPPAVPLPAPCLSSPLPSFPWQLLVMEKGHPYTEYLLTELEKHASVLKVPDPNPNLP